MTDYPSWLVENVARAIDPENWRIIDHWAGVTDPDCRVIDMREKSIARALAALQALPIDAMAQALEGMTRAFSPTPREDTEGWREEHEAFEDARTALSSYRTGEGG